MEFRVSENTCHMYVSACICGVHPCVYVFHVTARAYVSRGHRLKRAVSRDYLYFMEGLSLKPGVC